MRNGESEMRASPEATPNTSSRPPRLSASKAASIALDAPVASTAQSKPAPSSASALVAVALAPSRWASGSFAGLASTIATRAAPLRSNSSCPRISPIVPAPTTSTDSPGATRRRCNPRTAHETGSTSAPALRLSSSGSR